MGKHIAKHDIKPDRARPNLHRLSSLGEQKT